MLSKVLAMISPYVQNLLMARDWGRIPANFGTSTIQALLSDRLPSFHFWNVSTKL
jgi:hypothetical protein